MAKVTAEQVSGAVGVLVDLFRGLSDTVKPSIDMEAVKIGPCCAYGAEKGFSITVKVIVNDISGRAQNNSGVETVKLYGWRKGAPNILLKGDTRWRLSKAEEANSEDQDVSRQMTVCAPCAAVRRGMFTLSVEAVDDSGNRARKRFTVPVGKTARKCCKRG